MYKAIAIISFLYIATSFNAQSSDEVKFIGHSYINNQKCTVELIPSNDSIRIEIRNGLVLNSFNKRLKDTIGHDIYLDLLWNFNPLVICGNISNQRFTGTLIYKGITNQLTCYQANNIDNDLFQSIQGHYSINGQPPISIFKYFNRARVHNPYTGATSHLYANLPGVFVDQEGELYEINKNGFNNLTFHLTDKNKIRANKGNLIKEEKDILSLGTDTIGVSLFLPEGEGPFPGLIISRGAARFDRSPWTMEGQIFSANGIAVLIYDNFGFGETKGVLTDMTFEDKSVILEKLFYWLGEHDQINKEQIILQGGSQGGRVAMMTAAKNKSVFGLIMVSVPLETRKDQQLYAISAYHRNMGIDEVHISKISNLWNNYFELVENEQINNTLIPEIQSLREKYPRAILPSLTENQVPFFENKADLTSSGKEYMAKVQCPVLALYGHEDNRVPPFKSAQQVKQETKHKNVTVYTYPGSDHSLMQPGNRILPDLFEIQINWIKYQLSKKQE